MLRMSLCDTKSGVMAALAGKLPEIVVSFEFASVIVANEISV